MNENKSIHVYIGDKKVGTLALTANHMVAFEYDNEWIATGYSISPFSLPLEKGVFIPKKYETFEGLFGVFADSLPDGWGRLLVDRMLLKNHINYECVLLYLLIIEMTILRIFLIYTKITDGNCRRLMI